MIGLVRLDLMVGIIRLSRYTHLVQFVRCTRIIRMVRCGRMIGLVRLPRMVRAEGQNLTGWLRRSTRPNGALAGWGSPDQRSKLNRSDGE